MSATITFVLPTLFEPHCYQFLHDAKRTAMQQLTRLLARSNKQSIGNLTEWISNYYQLSGNFANSAKLMALASGLTISDTKEKSYWLRADPVMLTATHNGILCRGNRLLNLSKAERASVELLVNDYLREQSIELFLPTASQGYLKLTEQTNCQFIPLSETIGQDISHRLPRGDNEAYWHRLLIDLQMLLHNCKVNQQRSAEGHTEMNGLWLWAETELDAKTQSQQRQSLYTDDLAIAGALAIKPNLKDLPTEFDLEYCKDDLMIYVCEFQEALVQNDMDFWNDLFERWVMQWLLPAIKAVNSRKLDAVTIIAADGYSYQYSAKSSWCFWRNHSFLEANKE